MKTRLLIDGSRASSSLPLFLFLFYSRSPTLGSGTQGRLVPILKTVHLEDSEFVFDRLPNSKNGRFGRFGRFGRPAEPSAPKAVGLADFGEILDFICRTLKTKQLCCFEEHCVWSGTMSPSLRSLPFSEFGRFGIINQTHRYRWELSNEFFNLKIVR